MAKYPAFVLAVLLFISNCFADTFIHRRSGESFNGYVVQITKGNKTQVRTEKRKPQYLDLSDYEIHYNYLGRKNKVFSFSIKDSVDMICVAEAFEDAIEKVANQGPLFIIIQIDTREGRIDLAVRICDAITKIDNCRTVAFVSGGESGGAYSAGAMIALACDKLYMAENAAIGSFPSNDIGRSFKRRMREDMRSRRSSVPTIPENFILPYRPDVTIPATYVAALAEQNGRSGLLAKAMVDKDIEVLEITENGKTRFIEHENKKPDQTVLRVWSENGSLLALTPSEAVYCKIADNIIPSVRQLLVSLDATEARLVQDADCEKAKRQFEKVKKKFYETLGPIPVLEKLPDKLLRELDRLERTIRSSKIRIERYTSRGSWRKEEKDALKKMVKEQQQLKKRLLSILNNLKKKYKEAAELGKEYLDLNADVGSLVEGMNSATARYNEVLNRLSP